MFKKLIATLCILSIAGIYTAPAMAADAADKTVALEHLNVHKDAPCNIVTIKTTKKIVEQGNVLLFKFDEKFFSKKAQAGDIVHFDVPEALYTDEGTLILPKDTKIVAEITQIEKPKWFNKNARVNLIFKQIVLPDNTCIDIKARPFTKDYKLKEGPWTTTGKIVASTLTMGIIGAGAGVGFAFIPTPAKIGAGFAIGIPVGCGVGLALGLITPGCHYKAKKGEAVYAILIEEFSVNNK